MDYGEMKRYNWVTLQVIKPPKGSFSPQCVFMTTCNLNVKICPYPRTFSPNVTFKHNLQRQGVLRKDEQVITKSEILKISI